jgi:hypothetical protein
MSFDFDFLKLLAGLGIFLFGMVLIEDSVKSLSGSIFWPVPTSPPSCRPVRRPLPSY